MSSVLFASSMLRIVLSLSAFHLLLPRAMRMAASIASFGTAPPRFTP
jgi:hypothetical protein